MVRMNVGNVQLRVVPGGARLVFSLPGFLGRVNTSFTAIENKAGIVWGCAVVKKTKIIPPFNSPLFSFEVI